MEPPRRGMHADIMFWLGSLAVALSLLLLGLGCRQLLFKYHASLLVCPEFSLSKRNTVAIRQSAGRHWWNILRDVTFLTVRRKTHLNRTYESRVSSLFSNIGSALFGCLQSYSLRRPRTTEDWAQAAREASIGLARKECLNTDSLRTIGAEPARRVLPAFESWVGVWEEDRHEREALLAFLRNQGIPWLVALMVARTYFTCEFYIDAADQVLCSTAKVAGVFSSDSRYVDGSQNVTDVPLPGMRIRNIASFTIEGDTILTKGEIRVVDGPIISSNITLVRRHPETDEIELRTIDERNGSYSRFLRRCRARSA